MKFYAVSYSKLYFQHKLIGIGFLKFDFFLNSLLFDKIRCYSVDRVGRIVEFAKFGKIRKTE